MRSWFGDSADVGGDGGPIIAGHLIFRQPPATRLVFGRQAIRERCAPRRSNGARFYGAGSRGGALATAHTIVLRGALITILAASARRAGFDATIARHPRFLVALLPWDSSNRAYQKTGRSRSSFGSLGLDPERDVFT